MKRSLSFLLVLAMIFSVLPGVIAGAETGSGTGTLEINEASVFFGSDVYLLIAVDYSGLGIDVDAAKADVTIKVSHKNSAEPEELFVDESVMATKNFPENSVGFKCEIGAKNMGDVLTLQAYYNDEVSGDPLEYSILEYAINAKVLCSDNEYLVDALDKMLMFGAAAQEAFNYEGDYTLYDENGYVEHGIVSVFNSISKVIAPVNSVITPTAPASEVDPILYDYSFNRMADNKIVVEEGINSYFFISSSDRTGYHFDATNPTLTKEMVTNSNNSGSTVTLRFFNDIDGNFYDTWKLGLNTNLIQITKKSGSNIASSELVKDENGNNLAIKMIAHGTTAANVQFRQQYTTKATSGAVNVNHGDVFTLSVVVGKEGTTLMPGGDYRFRADNSADNRVNMFGFTNQKKSTTVHATSSDGALLGTIVADESGYGFFTMHIVVDLNAHTASYYVDGANTPAAVVSDSRISSANLYVANQLLEFMAARSGTILLQKLIYTKGNIFE